jgi:translocation and assembly module TamB
VTLGGHIGMQGPVDVTARLTDVAVAPICALASGARCAGRLSGEARLEGSAAAPRLRGAFRLPGLEVGGTQYGALRVEADYVDRRLGTRATLDHPRAGTLEVDARLPVDLSWDGPRRDLGHAPLVARLRTRELDLRFLAALAPTVVRDVTGRLSADLRLEGPRDALRASGTMALGAERLQLVATGVPWTDVVLRAHADAAGVEIETLSIRSGNGSLVGTGRVGSSQGWTPRLDLALALDDFLAIRQPAYEGAVTGRLHLDGTPAAPRVQGGLEVTRAVVRPAMLPSSAPSLEPDPTIEIVGTAMPPPSPPGGPPPFAVAESLALGIDVEIRRNAWIRRTDAQIELGGRLRIDKAPGAAPRTTGTVRLVRGWYAFQGRRFEIREGTITFTGQVPPDPTFEIVASHRTDQYRVLIEVGGTASAPSLRFSSEPPLEQADILSVIMFGKPARDLGSGESADLQRQAVSLASGYVAPELQSSVMETLGLDTLELGAERVQAGRYVLEDVFISIAQQFGTQAAQLVSLEYAFTPQLSVRATTSSRGNSSIDLQWHRRY